METEPDKPYVYQPFGVNENGGKRLWGVGGIHPARTTVRGLTRAEADAVCKVLTQVQAGGPTDMDMGRAFERMTIATAEIDRLKVENAEFRAGGAPIFPLSKDGPGLMTQKEYGDALQATITRLQHRLVAEADQCGCSCGKLPGEDETHADGCSTGHEKASTAGTAEAQEEGGVEDQGTPKTEGVDTRGTPPYTQPLDDSTQRDA